jgi:hypothetical protein
LGEENDSTMGALMKRMLDRNMMKARRRLRNKEKKEEVPLA